MRKNFFFSLLLLAGILSGCVFPSTATPTAMPTSPWSVYVPPTPNAQTVRQVIKVGFTVSLSGSLAEKSAMQKNGIMLWMDRVNRDGGIEFAQGSFVSLEPVFYDDKSDPELVETLYTRLIQDDNVSILLSPASPALAEVAASVANRYRKVMLVVGAENDSIYRLGYKYVFQINTSAERHLVGLLGLLKAQAPNVQRIALLYDDSSLSKTAFSNLRLDARARNYLVVYDETYPAQSTDFSDLLTNVLQSNAEILITDQWEVMSRQVSNRKMLTILNSSLRTIVILDSKANLINEIDTSLEPGLIRVVQWDFASKPKPGVLGNEFVQIYQDKYNEVPTYYAAAGYATGLVIQNVLEKMENFSSLDSSQLRSNLEKVNLETFFGKIQFSINSNSYGMQIGDSMIYLQLQRAENGNLVEQIIWPDNIKGAPLFLYDR